MGWHPGEYLLAGSLYFITGNCHSTQPQSLEVPFLYYMVIFRWNLLSVCYKYFYLFIVCTLQFYWVKISKCMNSFNFYLFLHYPKQVLLLDLYGYTKGYAS